MQGHLTPNNDGTLTLDMTYVAGSSMAAVVDDTSFGSSATNTYRANVVLASS